MCQSTKLFLHKNTIEDYYSSYIIIRSANKTLSFLSFTRSLVNWHKTLQAEMIFRFGRLTPGYFRLLQVPQKLSQ